jgi:Protein of unknown function (DUF998)
VRAIPWWSLLSAAIAPVVLIAGWLVVQMRQPASYDPIHDTLSSLTPVHTLDRGILLGAPVTLGICQIVTAAGLRPIAAAGRIVLAIGGAALAVAVLFPQRAGSLTAHGIVVGTAFLAFALWPVAAMLAPQVETPSGRPWVTRPRVVRTASVVLVLLAGWFAAELFLGARAGLAERVTSAADTLWPLTVVVSCRRPGTGLTPDHTAHSTAGVDEAPHIGRRRRYRS